MDKSFIDFKMIYNIKKEKCCFVVREKNNSKVDLITRRPVDLSPGIISDKDIGRSGLRTHKRYSHQLRRITFYDTEFNRPFFTNNFTLKAETNKFL